MARVAFLYKTNNLWSAAASVISASASASALPAANAADPDRSKIWRSTTTTGDQWIKADLGSAQDVAAVAVANVKLHGSGGTLKIQHSPDNSAWTDQATFGAQDTDSKVAFVLFS